MRRWRHVALPITCGNRCLTRPHFSSAPTTATVSTFAQRPLRVHCTHHIHTTAGGPRRRFRGRKDCRSEHVHTTGADVGLPRDDPTRNAKSTYIPRGADAGLPRDNPTRNAKSTCIPRGAHAPRSWCTCVRASHKSQLHRQTFAPTTRSGGRKPPVSQGQRKCNDVRYHSVGSLPVSSEITPASAFSNTTGD
ncbi:hypothetical protein HRbin36_02520 [bacterium HR36]|nr:hypothetical protein HRbin36_02520 [bacterium HR36]